MKRVAPKTIETLLLISLLCALSFVVGRRSVIMEIHNIHAAPDTNELDRLQQEISSQK